MQNEASDTETGEAAAPEAQAELDARGLLCPLPVLKARKRLNPLEVGAVLKMIADDPAAAIDVPHFCAEQGHELIAQHELGEAMAYFIRKGG